MKTKILAGFAISFIILISFTTLVSALIIQSVSTVPGKIAPGESAEISMIIKNNAEDDITDVSVNLDFTNVPFSPYLSGGDFITDEIREGRTKEAEFKIIADNDAKSGTYKIPVDIKYTQNDAFKEQQTIISMTVIAEPIIDVSYEDALFLKGKENKITVKIINKGLGDARFLEIKADSGTYYSLLSQPDVYVGDVDSNDFQTTDYNIYLKPTALDRILIPVTVYYKDAANKEYVVDKELNLRVYSQKQAVSLGLIKTNYWPSIIIGVILIIVVFLIIRAIKRSKRRKMSE